MYQSCECEVHWWRLWRITEDSVLGDMFDQMFMCWWKHRYGSYRERLREPKAPKQKAPYHVQSLLGISTLEPALSFDELIDCLIDNATVCWQANKLCKVQCNGLSLAHCALTLRKTVKCSESIWLIIEPSLYELIYSLFDWLFDRKTWFDVKRPCRNVTCQEMHIHPRRCRSHEPVRWTAPAFIIDPTLSTVIVWLIAWSIDWWMDTIW